MIINVELCDTRMRETRTLELTSKQVEETVGRYRYSGEGLIKDDAVENAHLPTVALVFYSMIFETHSVPSPDEVVSKYLTQSYFSIVNDKELKVEYNNTTFVLNKEGVIARVLRTYPSLLRDFHFYLLCVESKKFDCVYYNYLDDIGGIDIQVSYRGIKHALALRMDSKRSNEFRERKKFRHPNSDVEVIDVLLSSNNRQKCGDFYLYQPNQIDVIINSFTDID